MTKKLYSLHVHTVQPACTIIRKTVQPACIPLYNLHVHYFLNTFLKIAFIQHRRGYFTVNGGKPPL